MTTSNNSNNSNNNDNSAKEGFMDGGRKSYATIAGYASVAVASGIALYSGRDVTSVVAGAAVGSAYAYLAGGMADTISILMPTTGKVALATLVGAGSFLMTAGVVDAVETLSTKSEFNAVVDEALF